MVFASLRPSRTYTLHECKCMGAVVLSSPQPARMYECTGVRVDEQVEYTSLRNPCILTLPPIDSSFLLHPPPPFSFFRRLPLSLFIPPSSFILHPSSFILPPSSFLLPSGVIRGTISGASSCPRTTASNTTVTR